MTAAEINSVIDNLCQIFGVTVDRLVPEMAKMNIARLATKAGVCILLIAVFFVAINVLLKKYGSAEKLCERLDEDPFLFSAVCVGGFAVIIALIVLFFVIPDLAQWIASPLGSTIEVIASAIGG